MEKETKGIVVFYNFSDDDQEVSGPDHLDYIKNYGQFLDFIEEMRSETMKYYKEFLEETGKTPESDEDICPFEEIFFENKEDNTLKVYDSYIAGNISHSKYKFIEI